MQLIDDFRYTSFPVYKDAKQLYFVITKVTKQFPREYWELGDQMRRSALSVILNIADGSAKKSDKDFNRYLKNSLVSVNECVAGIDISVTAQLTNTDEYTQMMKLASIIAKQLGGFSKSLK